MITHNIRERLDKDFVKKRYTEAINLYNENLDNENYMVSFLIISALLEERINVCWVLLNWFENDREMRLVNKPTPDNVSRTPIKSKMNYLLQNEWVEKNEFHEIKSLFKVRNYLIHLSLYNTKEYTREICDEFYSMFRKMDKISKEIKQMVDEGK